MYSSGNSNSSESCRSSRAASCAILDARRRLLPRARRVPHRVEQVQDVGARGCAPAWLGSRPARPRSPCWRPAPWRPPRTVRSHLVRAVVSIVWSRCRMWEHVDVLQHGQAHARRALARLVGSLPRSAHRAPELGDSAERAVRGDAERRVAVGDMLECVGEDRVASEQCCGLVEGDVVGGAATAERVVVVDEQRGMDHLGGVGERGRGSRGAAAELARRDAQHGADALAAGEDGVAHGLAEALGAATEPRPARRAQPWPWQTVLLHREADCNILQKQQ